jgi:RNA polymerase sigma-70 factor (ECF subfamily)
VSYATVCVPDTTETVETPRPAMGKLSDEQLIVKICRREQEAFACLLGRHLDAVHGYLFRLTGSHADADDLSQETFLRVWKKAASFKPGQVKVTTWLFRIAHNLCVDQFRKQQKHIDLAASGLAIEDLEDPATNQTRQLIGRETLNQLDKMLRALPEGQRSALMLCQVQGFSNLEAASILGISVHALESLLARARRRLKKEFAEPTT